VRKLLLVLVLSCLATPSPATSAVAHPDSESYYLHCQPNPGDPTAGASFFLDVTVPETAPCGGDTNAGATGAISIAWPARTGLPVILDATRDVTGNLEFRGLYANSDVVVKLVGTVNGAKKTLGKAKSETIAGPTGTFDFELPLGNALQGNKLTKLSLITMIEGQFQSAVFGLDAPSSITLPTLHIGKRTNTHHHHHHH
jgi:hypothetical protein